MLGAGKRWLNSRGGEFGFGLQRGTAFDSSQVGQQFTPGEIRLQRFRFHRNGKTAAARRTDRHVPESRERGANFSRSPAVSDDCVVGQGHWNAFR